MNITNLKNGLDLAYVILITLVDFLTIVYAIYIYNQLREWKRKSMGAQNYVFEKAVDAFLANHGEDKTMGTWIASYLYPVYMPLDALDYYTCGTSKARIDANDALRRRLRHVIVYTIESPTPPDASYITAYDFDTRDMIKLSAIVTGAWLFDPNAGSFVKVNDGPYAITGPHPAYIVTFENVQAFFEHGTGNDTKKKKTPKNRKGGKRLAK